MTFMRLLALLPAGASRALGRGLGSFTYHVVRLRRHVVLTNLRHVIGAGRTDAEIRAIAADAYRQFGMTLIEIIRLCVFDLKRAGIEVEIENEDRLQAARDAGKPLIFCTPHNSNFDAGSYAFGQKYPVNVVMKALESPRFNDLVVRTRNRQGLKMILVGKGTYDELEAFLRRGEWIAVLPDQNAKARGITVNFLGQPASLFKGPALLHLETGAQIVVATVVRNREKPGKLYDHMTFIDPYPPTGDREADLVAVTQRIADAIAAIILRDPGQYFWFHRMWGKKLFQDPPGAGGGGGERAITTEMPRRSPVPNASTP